MEAGKELDASARDEVVRPELTKCQLDTQRSFEMRWAVGEHVYMSGRCKRCGSHIYGQPSECPLATVDICLATLKIVREEA